MVTKLSDFDLQEGFRLVSCIHPDRAVALCVLMDACNVFPLIENLQRRRHGYKLQTPVEGQFQFSIYLTSELWEKDQESKSPRREPLYLPNGNDRIVRYVKALARNSIDWHSRYGAVGIGCLLYRYDPHEVSELAEDIFNGDNIRRVKSTMSKLLKKRFDGARGLTNGNGELPFVEPKPHQRSLIERSLSVLAPWSTCPAVSAEVSVPLLETYFAKSSCKSEWERLHVLFHLACGGFPQLVNEYNATFRRGNKMRLGDPETKLGCPKFGNDFHGSTDEDEDPPDPGDRFDPSPLTREEISTIRHSVRRNQRRRNNYRSANALRVVVDGETIATFDPNVVPEPFAIPANASCIELFGADEDGEILLAIFPVIDHDSDIGFEHQVSSNRSLTVELSMSSPSPAKSSEGQAEIAQRLVWLRISESLLRRTSTKRTVSSSSVSRSSVLLMTGATGARYMIRGLLGKGAFGDVYLADDVRKKAQVVIKVFPSGYQRDATRKHLRAVLLDIHRLKELEHPNVMRIFDLGKLEDDRPYAVMESVSAANLRTKIGPQGMELTLAAQLIRQITEALGTLHEHSILHRDIKPENILIEEVAGEPSVKLCDFGIARDLSWSLTPNRFGATSVALTHSLGYGSSYMAPELLTGASASVQSDIYAFGVTVYEMLTGQLPVPLRQAAKPLEGKWDAQDVCDMRYELPKEMRDVIAQALMVNPKDRYRRIGDFGEAMARAITEKPTVSKITQHRDGLSDPVSIRPAVSGGAFPELLCEIALQKRPVSDLMLHIRFRVMLERVCSSIRIGVDVNREDLYQTVCLKLLKEPSLTTKLRSLIPVADDRNVMMTRCVRGWMYRAALNHCLNARRHSECVKEHEEVTARERTKCKLNSVAILEPAGPDPEQLLLQKEAEEKWLVRTAEIRARVRRVITSHSEDYVTIAYLWGVGKKPQEIAAESGVPLQTVFRRLRTMQKAVIREIELSETPEPKDLKRYLEAQALKQGVRELFASSLRGTGR